MKWFSQRHGAYAEMPSIDARPPASCFRQLQVARERQLAWTRDFASANDVASALDAFLDANAIIGELEVDPV